MERQFARSEALFKEANKYLPGGVNSPVRAFRSVGRSPLFIEKGKGSRLWDADGNEYIDFIGSWGPMILGHGNEKVLEEVKKALEQGLSFGAATEREVKIARFICESIPSIEMIRMVNSGTEAVMSALRAARGFTGKNKIIKFEGCYHGHTDAMLSKAGSGVMTQGISDSAGVPADCVKDTLSARYNDLESVKSLFEANPGEIAAVIVEPVGANMGVVLPKEGFLEGLRGLCDENKALLIFDEVITGFRLSFEGAQGYFGVKPDLSTFGKIIGGGMPVGAYGGRKEIMEMVAPLGPVYQAGTLSGNPIAMAAGMAQLKLLKETPDFYKDLNSKGDGFFAELAKTFEGKGIPFQVNHIGSLGCVFFAKTPVTDYDSAKKSDTGLFTKYFTHMLSQGIYLAPSQFEAMFLSSAHSQEDLERTLEAARAFQP